MNIQPLKMSPPEARERARIYGKQVVLARSSRVRAAGSPFARVVRHTEQEREDEALRKAYSALARGQQVVHMPTVIRQAGVTTDTFLPRLALARVDAVRVQMYVGSTEVRFVDRANRHRKDRHLAFAAALYPRELTSYEWRHTQRLPTPEAVTALCPQIPPNLRPSYPEGHYLMWEPVWLPKPPDPDPFIVKPLGGGFFVIVAQWDMTPLEQAILEGRLGS